MVKQMGDCENVNLNLIYSELKKINQRMASLEHLIIPEEKLSKEELKEIDELISDAKKGNITPFYKLKK